MKPNIGITEDNRSRVAAELNKVLADEYILYTKTRNYHWNIEGDNFSEMHKLYESQYEELDVIIDEVAEKIRMIGHFAKGRLKDYIKLSALEEPDDTNHQSEQLRNLLKDHELIIQNLRKLITEFSDKYQDLGTSDFVTGLMQQHEKMAWFIRAYLK